MYLNCHTYYSLRYGTLSPEQLVTRAARWGAPALALTDINNTSCTYEFITRCRRAGVKPIVGIDFRDAGGRRLFVGLARNAEGWRELCRLLSDCSLDGKALPAVAPPLPNTWIIYPTLLKPIAQFRDNELLGIRPEHVARLFSHDLRNYQHKLVAFHPVTFFDDEGYAIHRLLRAIDYNTVLSKLADDPNTYRCAKKNDRLLPPETLAAFYRNYPLILHNTQRIVDSCHIEMDNGLRVNRHTFTGDRDGDYQLLEKLAYNGCRRRYAPPGVTPERAAQALARVERELKVIRQQDFCAYFLITWDLVRYACSAGYHHVGRGSGANSIVAYCLEITDVDPLELDLYFERFINPYRASPPDFDIDFSWDQRDDVTDYLFKRYGHDHTALLATYSTFQGRAVVRELGKVFGLPKADIDKIVDDPFHTEQHHELAKDIIYYGEKIEGFPNHLSIHAGGVVISERPIHYHTALQLMPKGFPVTHFNMHHAEDLGFHKFDVLSQRGLGHIKDAVELIRRNQGRAVDVHDIPRITADERVRAQLRSASCIGCFYIESPAMRGLLTRLRCDTYVHLVAASSIIRPGVARSGMMREYIHRFHHPHAFEYPHPTFEQHLGETFGIMVYQEDVMKIVHHFAGLDLDESDVLRRVMTGKKARGEAFERLHRKYLDNCRARGYSEELTAEVWRQIESFSGYSFCKAHSASFAVESFQSLFLKTYFPLEFMVAVINNFGGFYRTEYYVHEARRSGGAIHAPCINHSDYLTTIEGTDIYLGFGLLRGMEQVVARRIVAERTRRGPFRDLADFVNRVDSPPEQIDLLIRIGAFRFTGRNKYELLWERIALVHPREGFEGTMSLWEEQADRSAATTPYPKGRGGQTGGQADGQTGRQADRNEVETPYPKGRGGQTGKQERSDDPENRGGQTADGQTGIQLGNASAGMTSAGMTSDRSYQLPEFSLLPHDQALDEIELLGFPLCSPFALIDAAPSYGCVRVKDLSHHVGRIVHILGYYVCQKPVRTVRGELMAFGTWLDEDGVYFDTTHFPNFLRRHPFRGRGVYNIEGKVVEEYGYLSLEVLQMVRCTNGRADARDAGQGSLRAR